MKKTYLILGVFLVLFVLGAGCSKQKPTTSTPETEKEKTVQEDLKPETEKAEPVAKPKAQPVVKKEVKTEPVVELKKVTCTLGDMECFEKGLKNCNLTTSPFSFIGPVFLITTFDEGDNCRIRQDAGTGWDEEDYKMFNGTYFDCTLSKAKLKDNSANVYMEIWTGKDYMKNNCVGSYITAMDEFLAQ